MTKVLIDIPDIPKNDHQRWVLTHGGIALDDLTNGEVIQKMFPDADVRIMEEINSVMQIFKDCYSVFDLDWWNRKWGE